MSAANTVSLKKGLAPLLLLAGFGLLAFMQLQSAEGVDVKQAETMIKQGAVLIDVREPAEYAEVHAPDARLIPLGELKSRLTELAPYKDKPIVVMCRSGHRSARAAEMLQEAGYTKVSSMRGGIMAWEGSGLTVIRSRI